MKSKSEFGRIELPKGKTANDRAKENANWPGFEVVSSYTDAQAVEDGVLVALNPRDRVTGAAWEYFVANAPVDDAKDPQPEDLRQSYARGISADFIGQHRDEANRVYRLNLGGGIFSFEYRGRKMWLVPNENRGLTLMFPEDY